MKFPHTKNLFLFLIIGLASITLTGCYHTNNALEETSSKTTINNENLTEELSGIPPELKSATPVIHLADNLEEPEKLGWCIDTEGREFADTLQAHSCKPASTTPLDTQFSYNPENGQLYSVAYSNKCVSFSDPENKIWPFGLLDCVDGEQTQKFVYDTETNEIRIGLDQSQCITVSTEIDDAGPYVSRDLIYAPCDSLDPKYKKWVIKD